MERFDVTGEITRADAPAPEEEAVIGLLRLPEEGHWPIVGNSHGRVLIVWHDRERKFVRYGRILHEL